MKHIKIFESLNKEDIFDAIENNDLYRAKELINSGIDIEKINLCNDSTPLYSAVVHNSIEILKELIKAGANVNYQNLKSTNSILIIASMYNDIKMIKELIKAGADWFIKNKYDNYFLDYLSSKNKQKIIKLYPEKYEDYLIKKESEKYNI